MAKKLINVVYKVDDTQLRKLRGTVAESEKQTKALSDKLEDTGNKAKKAGQDGAGGFMNFNNVVKVISFTAIIAGLTALGKKIIDITSNFQKYEALLTNTFGSKSAARAAFVDIQKQAAQTNFSLQEVTQGYLKLANNGIAPTNDEMTAFFDLTNNAGKGFDMFVEAVNDAVNGEFERLKEFFIKGSKDGDKVTLMFKNQKFTVDNNAQSIKKLLVQLGQLNGVAGSTAAIAGTLEGQMSNFGDNIDQLLKNLGSRGQGLIGAFFTLANDAVGALNDALTDNVKYLEDEQVGINVLVGAITDVNIPTEVRSKLIEELNRKYPDFLRNLDAEKVTNEQLSKRLKDVNDQFFKKIALTAAEERFKDSQQDILDLIDEEVEMRKHLERIRSGEITFKEDLKEAGFSAELKEKMEIARWEDMIANTQAERAEIQKELSDRLVEYNTALNIFNESGNDYFEIEKKSAVATEQKTKAVKDAGQAVQDYLATLSDQAMFETQAQIDANQRRRQIERENAERSSDLQEYFRQLRLQKERETEDESIRIAEDAADQRALIYQNATDAILATLDSIVDASFSSADMELEALNERYNQQVQLAGDNERARMELQVKFDREREVLEKRQSDQRKKQALTRIAIDTAVNAVKLFAETVPPGILSAIAIAFGALQAGIVSKQKFKDGGWIKGPGTETSDSIPIMASKNEFMVNADAARRSPNLLEAINSKKLTDQALRGAARGGMTFNDARMVSELAAIRKDLALLQTSDIAERGGVLFKVRNRNETIKQYIRQYTVGKI